MFILNLTYVKPIIEVEKYLDAHISFLEKYYKEEKIHVQEESSFVMPKILMKLIL